MHKEKIIEIFNRVGKNNPSSIYGYEEVVKEIVDGIFESKDGEELLNVIEEVVRDCSETIRKNPMYTSFYQNPDTMADKLLNNYGIK